MRTSRTTAAGSRSSGSPQPPAPASTWRDISFDDSTWKSGAAELGYGDGDEQTVVGYGGNANAKFITTWFRRSFDVANPANWLSLSLRARYDDGAAVYLNGVEVLRGNLPGGAIGPGTLASASVPATQLSSDQARSSAAAFPKRAHIWQL